MRDSFFAACIVQLVFGAVVAVIGYFVDSTDLFTIGLTMKGCGFWCSLLYLNAK